MAEIDLARLITDVKESLKRELMSLEREVRQGFAAIVTRLTTRPPIWTGTPGVGKPGPAGAPAWTNGQRRLTRLSIPKDREVAELRARLDKLEHPPS